MKNLGILLDYYIKIMSLQKKYHIKLMLMFSTILISFITCIYLIISETTENRWLVNIVENSMLLLFLRHPIVNKIKTTFISPLVGFNASHEIMVLLLFSMCAFLIILFILSMFYKLLFIPLMLMCSFTFYKIFHLYKVNFNTSEMNTIFKSFGFTLQEKIAKEQIIDEINQNFDFYQKKGVYDLSTIDKSNLLFMIEKKNFSSMENLSNYVKEYFYLNVKEIPQVIEPTSIWTNIGISPSQAVLIITISVIIIGSVLIYSQLSVTDVLNKQVDVNTATLTALNDTKNTTNLLDDKVDTVNDKLDATTQATESLLGVTKKLAENGNDTVETLTHIAKGTQDLCDANILTANQLNEHLDIFRALNDLTNTKLELLAKSVNLIKNNTELLDAKIQAIEIALLTLKTELLKISETTEICVKSFEVLWPVVQELKKK